MDVTLAAVFEEVSGEEGGGYRAYGEGFPEAIREGNSLADARENLIMAVEHVLETDRAFVDRLLGENRRITQTSPKGSGFIREKIKVQVP